MNWKQMLEVKPGVETAVDVMTSGDPCCETARDKMIETLKNFVATFPNKIKRPDELELFIREIDCEDLDILMDQIIENSTAISVPSIGLTKVIFGLSERCAFRLESNLVYIPWPRFSG